jgi:ribosomal protein S18 acetylase RimI-like enzyme
VLPAGSSREHQLCGIFANHCRWFAAQAAAVGGHTEPVPGGGTLVVYPHEVVLAFPKIPERAMAPYLDGVVARCFDLYARGDGFKQASCWARDPKGHGAIGARLAARGFEWGWQSNWMSLDLHNMNTDIPTPPGLRIVVDDQADWSVEELPYHSANSIAFLSVLSAARPRRAWHFGAWLDGILVGHSVLLLATGRMGVGGIYNVGVIPSARNRGIGRMVTLAACLAARQCGFNYVTLNAATHIYDRIGFTSLGRGQTWWLHGSVMANPPSRAEVAFAEAVGTGDLAALDGLTTPPDLDAPLACGLSPIDLAVRSEKLASVKWLVSRGATLHIVPAWDLGWKEEAARLLAARPELLNRRSGRILSTPMHEAVLRNDVELARLLLNAGPDLSIADTEYNSTPLGWARHFNRTEIIALIEG